MPEHTVLLGLLAVVAVISVVVGCWLISPALGLIVNGLIVGFIAYAIAYIEVTSARRRKED